jgi:adenosylhomocysteine nucleosidase
MEGAAVAQVCWEQNVPFLAIRSISDNANKQTPTMFDKFYKLAARNSARLVMAIVQIYSAKPAN